MAQFGRPEADITNQSWEEDDGTTVNIFDQIDEVVADDADFIRSAVAPTSDVYVCRLSAIEDPQVSTGHVVRYRYSKDAAGGAAVDVTVELRQDYVNEADQGTLIATLGTHVGVSEAWTAGSHTLSAGEADAITDYASLYVRIVADQQ